MDKTELAKLNGIQGKMNIIIPVHWLQTTELMLKAYCDDGQPICYSLDKINDCGIRVENPTEKKDDENRIPECHFKPSEETLERIRQFSRDVNNPKFKEYIKEGLNMRDEMLRSILDSEIRAYNIGNSDYSKHKTQPWDIWEEYHLNPWDSDVVKRILRTKQEDGMSEDESRIMDYEKIIHICKKRIEQLKRGYHF